MKSWGTQQQFPTEVLSETEHLKVENQKLKERIAVLESHLELTRGAMKADDNRLRVAGERVGLYFGCDTPESMADEIERIRGELGELHEKAVELSIRLRDAHQWSRVWKHAAKVKYGYLNCAAKIASKYIMKTIRLQQSRGRLVNLIRQTKPLKREYVDRMREK